MYGSGSHPFDIGYPVSGLKHAFKIIKRITDTDENVILPSRLGDTISKVPDVSTFVNEIDVEILS